MDMLSYVAGKETGAIALTKIGLETYQLVAKRFSQTTGQEVYPEILTLNRQQVDEAKAAADKALAEAVERVNGVKKLINDLDALDI